MRNYEIDPSIRGEAHCVVGVNSKPFVDDPCYEAGVGSTLATSALGAVMIAYCLWPAVELVTDKAVDGFLRIKKSLGLDDIF